MVGQQMIMEARMRNRSGQQSAISHTRSSRARHSRRPSSSVMHSIIKPLMAIGNALRVRLRLPE